MRFPTRYTKRATLLLGLLLGCAPAPDDPGPCSIGGEAGLVDGNPANPYPSAHLQTAAEAEATGCRLLIDAAESR